MGKFQYEKEKIHYYMRFLKKKKKHPKANRNIGGLGPQNKSEKS